MTWRQAVEVRIFELMEDLVKEGQTIDEMIVLKGMEGEAIRDILAMIASENCRSTNMFFPRISYHSRPVVCEIDFWKPTPSYTYTKWRMQG